MAITNSTKKSSTKRHEPFGMQAVVDHMTPVLAPFGFTPVAEPAEDLTVDNGVNFVNADGEPSTIRVQVSRLTYLVNEDFYETRDLGGGWSHSVLDGVRHCRPFEIHSLGLLEEVVVREMKENEFVLAPTVLDEETRLLTDYAIKFVLKALDGRDGIEIVPMRQDGSEILLVSKDGREIRFEAVPGEYGVFASLDGAEPVRISGNGPKGPKIEQALATYLDAAFSPVAPRPRP